MPPTGVKALHETPAARATGSSDVRSPARTMAVNGELLLITTSCLDPVVIERFVAVHQSMV